jgi:hypothetical protein
MYLINRLSTFVLGNRSPHEVLFGTPLVYSHLRVFGCACYPHLRPYRKDKLQPKSTKCVFLGYSTIHKNYKEGSLLVRYLGVALIYSRLKKAA